jgi:hypothetical protein
LQDEVTKAEKKRRLRKAYYDHGEVRCEGCNEVVDLSDANNLAEVAKIWNGHVRDEHE